MTLTTHPEGKAKVSAMTNALRNDPKALRNVLTARRKDIVKMIETAEEKGDEQHLIDLSDALVQIDAALQRLYETGTLDQSAPAEPQLQAGAALSAEDDEDDEDDEPKLGDGISMPSNKSTEEKAKTGPGVGLGFKQKVEEPSFDDDDDDDDNPVKMTGKLRKEMGDSAADFLDDYALAIYEKVDEFFDNLVESALDLGEEDDEDGTNDLIEMLRDEVGKRGLSKILPAFDEWRAGVIKKIMKDVNERFSPEPTAELEAPLEGDDAARVLGLDTEVPDEESAEAVEEALEEDDATEPAKEDDGDDKEDEAVEASTRRLSDVVRVARGPVSFKASTGNTEVKAPISASTVEETTSRATDFRPSGASTPRLE